MNGSHEGPVSEEEWNADSVDRRGKCAKHIGLKVPRCEVDRSARQSAKEWKEHIGRTGRVRTVGWKNGRVDVSDLSAIRRCHFSWGPVVNRRDAQVRSEERRVGKEC